MDLAARIKTFAELGSVLRDSLEGKPGIYCSGLKQLIDTQHLKNPWFTPGNVKMAVGAISEMLTQGNLLKWTDAYPDLKKNNDPFNTAVIMAGNIPLVGFHDFMTVLITGNRVIARTSSKDNDLIRFISQILIDIDSRFSERIVFAGEKISGFDTVIATGSDNTSRYFEQYFGKYPNIIRKNRNSIAILDGTETDEQLKGLGRDVFSYFGLGCRNVSKLYIPEGYDLNRLAADWSEFAGIINHQKYANNYDYNKAVFMVNRQKFFDTGFVILREERQLPSPVAVLNYEYYTSVSDVERTAGALKDKIQCITGKNHIPFGTAQLPALWDYADGADTVLFLLKKNITGIL